MTFGERLKRARTTAKLSQGELAARAKVSQKTISKIELGNQHRSTSVVALATACGVQSAWLADGTGQMLEGAGEPPAPSYMLSTAALEVARLWEDSPEGTKEFVRDLLAVNSALREILPPSALKMRPKEFVAQYRTRLIAELMKRR